MKSKLIIKNGAIALPGLDEPEIADLLVVDGIIADIGHIERSGHDVIEAEGLLILPGGIDPHVHFCDPGFIRREDFYCGTCAAASGGITTVIDMPCTSIPPVTDFENLDRKLDAIKTKAVIDYGLFGGVCAGMFDGDYRGKMGLIFKFVLGYKTYFLSGMPGFERLDHFQFERALGAACGLGLPVLLHAEDPAYVLSATVAAKANGDSPKDYYSSRLEIAEILAVGAAVRIAESVSADLHIVHISSAEAGKLIPGGKITGETAPHYLEFDVDDFERIGSPLKVNPPVKSTGNKRGLWELLGAGKLSFVASDHAPCPAEDKSTGSIWTDYSGIPGTGTLMPYMFSEGYVEGRIGLRRLVEATSSAAARRYGIFDRKGSIEPGKDADLVLIDPNVAWTVEGSKSLSKGKITPFDGMLFKGTVVKTILRGRVVFDRIEGITAQKGFGQLLTRSGVR